MRDAILVYGATGVTGRQAAAYVAAHSALPLVIAGRSREKLDAIAKSLPRPVEVRVADSADPASVGRAVSGVAVVVNTAGPFALYGDPVVAAAVELGVDYVDITGETPWVRTLIDRFDATARAKGARIVPMCGFDSVPSDLGAWMVARFLGPTREIYAAFSMKGGLNGGTAASALAMAESGTLRTMGDRRLLGAPADAPAETFRTVRWDDTLQRWLSPFFMESANTRVVRRSAMLFEQDGQGYGPAFSYWEAMETRRRAFALAQTAALGVAFPLLGRAWGRSLARRLVPAPGTGPSEATMDQGFFRTRLVGTGVDGRRAYGLISERGDPGNRATVKMLVESALALVQDRERLPSRAGLLTPATAFGGVLLDRLRAAGMRWEVGTLDGRFREDGA